MSQTSLSILIASDIHLILGNIIKVKEVLQQKNIKADIVLSPGDFCNLKKHEYSDKVKIAETEEQLRGLLLALESIAPKVYFIPGNHDPDSILNHKENLGCQNSIGVHRHATQIADNLFIAGFGGAPPSHFEHDLSPAWDGYPYSTVEEATELFDKFVEQSVSPVLASGANLLLMTHFGPNGVDTTKFQMEVGEPVIISGGSFLTKFIKTEQAQAKVVFNVHGHTHPGKGVTRIGRVPIINPGSLKENNYAVVVLKKNNEADWAIESTTLLSL